MARLQGATERSTAELFRRWPLYLAGRELVADRSGALWLEAERMLVVADLHLEKGSRQARRGAFLPPYDSRATLERLSRVVAELRPRTVVALGDSFHDAGAHGRLQPDDLASLRRLQIGREWIWLTGNHDPAIPASAGGEVHDELGLGGLVLRHMARPGETAGEIAGHLHPVAKVAGGGLVQRRPCCASNGRLAVLPAFGAYTGGLNVLDGACQEALAGGDLEVLVLGRSGVYPVPLDRLRPD